MNDSRENYRKCSYTKTAKLIASAARKSLILEVCTTPKPGLVDLKNNGAHTDMTFLTFFASARALYPYFLKCAETGLLPDSAPASLLPRLRPEGIQAEHSMYEATGGVNTHKGAIFSLGLFCAAAAYFTQNTELFRPVPLREALPSILRETCADVLSGLRRPSPGDSPTHGQELYHKYRISGIRGEAAKGFPSVFALGYPVYLSYKAKGLPAEKAGACTLVHLTASVEDTAAISRCGPELYTKIQNELKNWLPGANADDILRVLPELDDAFIQRNISPGGCADLLSLIYFLDILDGNAM